MPPSWKNTQIRAEGTEQIVRAMEQAGVRRLVSVSTMGAGDSWALLPREFRILFRTLLRGALRAHEQQERSIEKSALDWTVVRPGSYVGGELTSRYQHGAACTIKHHRARISRGDVADFLLKQLTDLRYVHQLPCLSY